MNTVRILARTLVVENNQILLVRNKGANFWYPPGGGWEYEKETIIECAEREVKEETGIRVRIEKMLWLQEYHENDKVFFETFWLARTDGARATAQDLASHIDEDPNGAVEEVRWFNENELTDLTVFPKRIKSFVTLVKEQEGLTDPFIGAFV